MRNKKPVEIASILHISFSSVKSVSEWTTRASPVIQKLLLDIQALQEIDRILDFVEKALYSLLLRTGTYWHQAAINRHARNKSHTARKNLR